MTFASSAAAAIPAATRRTTPRRSTPYQTAANAIAEAPEHDQAARELLDDEQHRQDQDRGHDHEDESRSRALSACR